MKEKDAEDSSEGSFSDWPLYAVGQNDGEQNVRQTPRIVTLWLCDDHEGTFRGRTPR